MSQPGTFLGHPKGLFVLFFTEMWERFSYYGMRALLVLYMVDFFKYSQEEASKVYKWYTSLVYLTPLIGGYLADRYLGNKMTIIIGAVLMAVGHFLMAFTDIWIFYTALGFLIVGNGFFKPNMSVQVGRLYPKNDPRRDGAYTIFYMGINLGAFLSPLVCGALKETPALGFHWAFGAAGVGMVLGLLCYLLGQPWIKELPEDAVYHDPDAKPEDEAVGGKDYIMTEEEAEDVRSVTPSLASSSPMILGIAGVLLLVGSPILWKAGFVSFDNCVMMEIAAISSFFAAWILSQLSMAVRDRVLAIYALFGFVVFFWGAFEQAGNAMTIWADQTTNRYLSETPPTPELYPGAPVDIAEEGFSTVFTKAIGKLVAVNPVLTTSFQSINALAIVVFAPLFAWLWLFLARRHINVSIPAKMSMGVFLIGMAVALMGWAAKYENQPSQTSLASLPSMFTFDDDGRVHFYDVPGLDKVDAYERFMKGEPEASDSMIVHGGRMTYDAGSGVLSIRGVLNANHRDRVFRATASRSFVSEIWKFAEKTKEEAAAAKLRGDDSFEVSYTLEELPAGFEPRYLNGFEKEYLSYDEATQTFTTTIELKDKEYKQILVAGSDPTIRAAFNDLYTKSSVFKVSSWWLFWFYILCTLGELCLSPVGLSMVSKLAPRRFATMLMGMWLLTSTFGNFVAGLAGEKMELYPPITFFSVMAGGLLIASFVCFLLIKKITAMMHGVK